MLTTSSLDISNIFTAATKQLERAHGPVTLLFEPGMPVMVRKLGRSDASRNVEVSPLLSDSQTSPLLGEEDSRSVLTAVTPEALQEELARTGAISHAFTYSRTVRVLASFNHRGANPVARCQLFPTNVEEFNRYVIAPKRKPALQTMMVISGGPDTHRISAATALARSLLAKNPQHVGDCQLHLIHPVQEGSPSQSLVEEFRPHEADKAGHPLFAASIESARQAGASFILLGPDFGVHPEDMDSANRAVAAGITVIATTGETASVFSKMHTDSAERVGCSPVTLNLMTI